MKKLLYIAALAVMSTSCSVDSIQDETPINSQDLKAKGSSVLYCTTANIKSDSGDTVGILESFADHNTGYITVRLTTFDWKIRESKMYFGPDEDLDTTSPGLFDLGKYGFTESFEEDTYVTEYAYLISNVKDDFALFAKLIITNDGGKENAWLEGNSQDGLYIMNAVSNCLEK